MGPKGLPESSNVRQLFHEYHKEMINTYVAGKFPDRLIEDHIQQIIEAKEKLQECCPELEAILKEDDFSLSIKRNEKCQKKLKSIEVS